MRFPPCFSAIGIVCEQVPEGGLRDLVVLSPGGLRDLVVLSQGGLRDLVVLSQGGLLDLFVLSPGGLRDLFVLSPSGLLDLVVLSQGGLLDLFVLSPGGLLDLFVLSPSGLLDLVVLSPGGLREQFMRNSKPSHLARLYRRHDLRREVFRRAEVCALFIDTYARDEVVIFTNSAMPVFIVASALGRLPAPLVLEVILGQIQRHAFVLDPRYKFTHRFRLLNYLEFPDYSLARPAGASRWLRYQLALFFVYVILFHSGFDDLWGDLGDHGVSIDGDVLFNEYLVTKTDVLLESTDDFRKRKLRITREYVINCSRIAFFNDDFGYHFSFLWLRSVLSIE